MPLAPPQPGYSPSTSMAEHKTTHAETKPTDTKPAVDKSTEPQNPVAAPVPDTEAPPPALGSWQAAFLAVAEELDAHGNQWLAGVFRRQALPLKPGEPETKSDATKSGK